MKILPVLFLSLVGVGFASADEPELGPMPRVVEPGFRVEKITAGYQILLNKSVADQLLKDLQKIDNEKEIGQMLESVAKDVKEKDLEARLKILAYVIANEAPAFKKSLADKMGENGVTIKVYGVERKGKDRPVLKAISKAFLPDEIQEKVKEVMLIANTTPLYWRIESR